MSLAKKLAKEIPAVATLLGYQAPSLSSAAAMYTWLQAEHMHAAFTPRAIPGNPGAAITVCCPAQGVQKPSLQVC